MKYTAKIRGIFSALGIFLLILDTKTAIWGARNGIELCLRTVIPSLFPFFVLSAILTGTLLGTNPGIFRPLGRFCAIPSGAESILLVGLLGGYPVGAQCVARACRDGALTERDAEKMLAYCNNAGPSFLFGMAGALFPNRFTPWVLWFIHIASALFVSRWFPCSQTISSGNLSTHSRGWTDAVGQAVRTMAGVCAWVVLFRVVLAFTEKIMASHFPEAFSVIVSGALELSNGCCALAKIENDNLRFLLCSGMLAFGGVCVTMQTLGVISGISARYYFPGKMMQTALSLLFSAALLYRGFFLSLAFVIVIGMIFLPKIGNHSRFSAQLRV